VCVALHDADWSALYREPMTCDFVSSPSNRCRCLWCRPSPPMRLEVDYAHLEEKADLTAPMRRLPGREEVPGGGGSGVCVI
jgi:hypothetical protein